MPQLPQSNGGFTPPVANCVPPPAVVVSGPWCRSVRLGCLGHGPNPSQRWWWGKPDPVPLQWLSCCLRAVSGSQAACRPFSSSLWLPRTIPNWDPLQCPSSLAPLALEGENRPNGAVSHPRRGGQALAVSRALESS